MNFLEPIKFKSCAEFLSEFGELTEASQVEKLHKKLGPYLLRFLFIFNSPFNLKRRVKEGVETSIPQKEETLIELELTLVQKQYYRFYISILISNKEGL